MGGQLWTSWCRDLPIQDWSSHSTSCGNCWRLIVFNWILLQNLPLTQESHFTFLVLVNMIGHSVQFSSVQSLSRVWLPLRPHESQHARPPCPSPSPGVHSDSRPSSQWCHPAISSLIVPFFSCPQSLPASKSFSMSQLFTWGGQSTGVSALASFLPKKSQGWSHSEWTG